MLNTDAVKAAAEKTGKGARKDGVRVTENVLRRAAEQANQACISIRGAEELETHRGLVSVTLGERTYQIRKNDTHAAWATKQGEQVDDFVDLFNLLAENPNKLQGTVAVD